ncbi:MAG TPA: HAD family phosphatase [Candidatus Bathyarchaeia archaeon]|nr:HAD family phosphatase [Candidatus Bathyarchaeia archaeon]
MMKSTSTQLEFRVNAILFDMDGVITDTMPYHYRAWEMAFKEITHHQITKEDVYLREGSKGCFALDEIFDQHGWYRDPELLKKLVARKEQLFTQTIRLEFIAGALDFLALAQGQGFRLALVTGTSRAEALKMLPPEVQARFSIMITASDVTHGKPDPEPYLAALKKLAVHANEAVVIENAPLGIQSAKAAGIRCLALETSLSREYLSAADGVFTSFADLTQQIKFVLA